MNKFWKKFLAGFVALSSTISPVFAEDATPEPEGSGSHTLELADAEHGSLVLINSNDESMRSFPVDESELVTVAAVAENGYVLKNITVTSSDETPVFSSDSASYINKEKETTEITSGTISEENDTITIAPEETQDTTYEEGKSYLDTMDEATTFSFLMPSSDVTVTATFEELGVTGDIMEFESVTPSAENQVVLNGRRMVLYSYTPSEDSVFNLDISAAQDENGETAETFTVLLDEKLNTIEGNLHDGIEVKGDTRYYIGIGFADGEASGEITRMQKSVHVTYTATEGGTVSLTEETKDISRNALEGSVAVPTAGYTFEGWKDNTGEIVSKAQSFIPEVETDAAFTAMFAQSANPEATADSMAETMNAEVIGKIDAIENLDIEFVSGATKNSSGDYVWSASSRSSGHQFIYRVSFSTSGDMSVNPNTIEIRIPRQILIDRNGAMADSFEIALASREEIASLAGEELDDNGFAYYTDGNEIVVYNYKTITAAVNAYFEMAYTTSRPSYEYFDYGHEKSGSNPVYAHMKAGDHTKEAEGNNVHINTGARISSVYKNYPTLYSSWQSSWGAKPADADDYFYLVWSIRTDIADSTQRYDFRLEDVPQSEGTEVVGYKMSGESTYSSKNTVTNQIPSSGYRYDSVLTRHSKAMYGDKTAYSITNRITGYVTPIDRVDAETSAVSTRTFQWTKPTFTIPTGHFNVWKYGNENWYRRFNYNWPYASYELEELQNGNISSIDNIKYYVESTGYAYPWTLKKDGTSDDPYAYGYKPVKYVLTDDTFYPLEADSDIYDSEDYVESDAVEPLSPEDYDIQYATLSFTVSDAVRDEQGKIRFNEETQTFTMISNKFSDEDIVTFDVKVNGSWINNAATLNLADGTASINDSHISNLTRSRIDFAEGVDGMRLTMSNNYYNTSFESYPYVSIKNSERVMNWIEGKDAVLLKNVVTMDVYDSSLKDGADETGAVKRDNYEFADAPFLTISKIIGDRIRKVERDSSLYKTTTMYENDKLRHRYSVHWRVDQEETITTGAGDVESVLQNSGTFYDLLPAGSTLKSNSVSVADSNGYLADNEFEYETINNYRDSGRTLLIVHVKSSGTNYRLYYSTMHTWEDMMDYGKTFRNPVAYSTGNDNIADGYADNAGAGISSENKEYMSNLIANTLYDGTGKLPSAPSGEPAKTFIYDEDVYTAALLTSAITGLNHKIREEKDELFSYETMTTPDGNYEYRIRFQNVPGSSSKNMIWFESLENYVLDDGTTSQWKGTYQGVNLSQLESKGIAPVVYYSAVENLDLSVESNHDLSNTSVWTKASEFGDVTRAKAVAIDMSRDTRGRSFVLGPTESVSAILYMKAPHTVAESEEKEYAEAYSNVYMQNTIVTDATGTEEDYYVHHDYTIIKYRVVGDFLLEKENVQDTSAKIKDISFRLFGTSDYGTYIDTTLTTDINGQIKFEDVEKGTYILSEYGRHPDWVEDHTEYEVRIDGNGDTFFNGNKCTDEYTHITNVPRVHVDVEFDKKALGSNRRVEGARFKLTGLSDYGADILKYATSDTSGTVTFPDVEKGKYTLQEIEAAPGYILENNKWTLVVDENANYTVTSEDPDFAETSPRGEVTVYNEPYHAFRLIKRSAYDGSAIEGVTFSLTGTSNYGNLVEKTVTSGANGFIEFTELEPGAYLLQEVSAPEKFVVDKTQRGVVVNRDGTIEITGLQPNEAGNYIVTNEEVPTDQVKVIKVWNDDGSPLRPEELPEIHISAMPPSELPEETASAE